jgi:deazaflavin-dependent oxidoreductase (nitroreductase family)
MGLPDAWSFRQRPTGVFKRFLRLPVYLFHWRLGFVLGDRIVLITHRGRKSGRTYQTPVEVVEHDRAACEYIVCSGTGPRADWYQNLAAEPALTIQVGNQHWTPCQRFLDPEEAARRFAGYETEHPRTARKLLRSMGNSYDGTDEGRLEMMKRMPMVAFSAHTPA